MINDYKNIVFYFKDEIKNTIFNTYAEELNDEELKRINESKTLDFDLIASFKKTPLILMVNNIIEYFEEKYVNCEEMEIISNIIASIILSIADPTFLLKPNRLVKEDKEMFSTIKLYFNINNFGETCISVERLNKLLKKEDVSLFLSKMEKYQFLIKEESRYCINDDYLIRIIKISKNNNANN